MRWNFGANRLQQNTVSKNSDNFEVAELTPAVIPLKGKSVLLASLRLLKVNSLHLYCYAGYPYIRRNY